MSTNKADDRDDPARHVARAVESAERLRDACQQAILDLGEAIVARDDSEARLEAGSERERVEGSTLRNLAALNHTRVRICLERCVELGRGLGRLGITGRSR